MRHVTLIIFCFSVFSSLGQTQLLNGDFENNSATNNLINLSNSSYSSNMSNSWAFGSSGGGGPNGGNMDIITSNVYCGLAQSGNWYVSLTGGGTDAISMRTAIPLYQGQNYELNFYDRACASISSTSGAVIIGVSNDSLSFGTLVYTAPSATGKVGWNKRTAKFTCPVNARFITVSCAGQPNTSEWVHVDNFSFAGCFTEFDIGKDTSICIGDSLTLNASTPLASYLWSDNSTDSVLTINQPGTYWARIKDTCGFNFDTIRVQFSYPPSLDLGKDSVMCEGNTINLFATKKEATYLWQDSSTKPFFSAKTTGTYWAEVTEKCGVARDSIDLTFRPIPKVDLKNDTSICVGDTLSFLFHNPQTTYVWHDGSTDSFFHITQAGQYHVTGSNNCGTTKDTVNIETMSPPLVDLGKDTSFCPHDTIILKANYPAIYLWSDNTTDSLLYVTSPGQYSIEVKNKCGSVYDSIVINEMNPPQFSLGNDTAMCAQDSLFLSVQAEESLYLWNDNSTDSTLWAQAEGAYSVTASNTCGSFSDTLLLTHIKVDTVSLGNDTSLCIGDSLSFNFPQNGYQYEWQDLSHAASYNLKDSGLYWVTQNSQCATITDSLWVQIDVLPTINLGKDTSLCAGDTLLLTAHYNNSTYRWQDNSGFEEFHVVDSGEFWVAVTNACGTTYDTINIDGKSIPNLNLGVDTFICEGDSISLNIYQANADQYRWDDLSSHYERVLKQEGLFWASITNTCGTKMDSIEVLFHTPPLVDLGPDTSMCINDRITLQYSTDFATYLWQDNSRKETFIVKQPGTYWINVTKCEMYSDTIVIQAKDCSCHLFTPTGFTPNQDGLNDHFLPVFECEALEYQLQIFNSWGEIVFSTTNPNDAWDGTYQGSLCPIGVYGYLIDIRTKQEVKSQKGEVSLLR